MAEHRMEISIEELQRDLRELKGKMDEAQVVAEGLGLQVVVRKKGTAETAPEVAEEPRKKRKYTRRKKT